jgi:hypothetical protein
MVQQAVDERGRAKVIAEVVSPALIWSLKASSFEARGVRRAGSSRASAFSPSVRRTSSRARIFFTVRGAMPIARAIPRLDSPRATRRTTS